MSKKALFVFNPLSGKGIIKNKVYEIVDMLVKNEYEVVIHPTQARKDAYHLVHETGGNYDLIICGGGDGTLDEVVRGLMRGEHKTPLGYIPAGSTNDFANSLQLPKRTLQAAKVAVEGKPFPCDVGSFNGKNFVYVAAFGVLTDVSYGTNQDLKNMLGHAAYVVEGIKRFHGLDSIHMKIDFDGKIIEDDFCYGMVGNSAYVAGMRINYCNEVKLDDGKFEIVLIKKPQNPVQLNRILSGMLSLTEEEELILIIQASHVKFYCDEPISWTLDGEFGGEHTEVEIEVCHKAIALKVKEDYNPVYRMRPGQDATVRMCRTPEELEPMPDDDKAL
ncbi:MAG: diacylglycerol kinase family lipid kinase [Eubacterium sp.]|nr:diacylglycerol kinase family lipid kinase [Eubacterium sp.]